MPVASSDESCSQWRARLQAALTIVACDVVGGIEARLISTRIRSIGRRSGDKCKDSAEYEERPNKFRHRHASNLARTGGTDLPILRAAHAGQDEVLAVARPPQELPVITHLPYPAAQSCRETGRQRQLRLKQPALAFWPVRSMLERHSNQESTALSMLTKAPHRGGGRGRP